MKKSIFDIFNIIGEKFKNMHDEGSITKTVLLIVTGVLLLFPFLSIQKKIVQSIGDQPKILIGTYAFLIFLVAILAIAIAKSKPRNPPGNP